MKYGNNRKSLNRKYILKIKNNLLLYILTKLDIIS